MLKKKVGSKVNNHEWEESQVLVKKKGFLKTWLEMFQKMYSFSRALVPGMYMNKLSESVHGYSRSVFEKEHVS